MVATPRSGAIEASKLTQAPGGPSLVLYMTEINTLPGTPLSPMGFAEWDIWNPTQMTFNERGMTNPTPRMIHARDRRHGGYTTIVFLDGHNEKRRLRTNDLPITLFNPYTAEPYLCIPNPAGRIWIPPPSDRGPSRSAAAYPA